MRRITMIILSGLLLWGTCSGQSKAWKKAYVASILCVSAGSTMDAVSSWSYPESNPWLRSGDGTFRLRGLMVKTGITAAVLGSEYLIMRKWPRTRKVLTVVNFGWAVDETRITVRNYQARRGWDAWRRLEENQ